MIWWIVANVALLCIFVPNASGSRISKKGAQIMSAAAASARTGQPARMCSCAQMNSCIQQDTQTMQQCSQQCYGVFNSVTRTPYALQPCLNNGMANQISSCMAQQMFRCGAGMATRYNYQTFYQTVLQQVQARRNELATTPPLGVVKNVAFASVDFGTCTLNCFVRTNRNQCFDSFGCQPQMNEQAISHAASVCFGMMEKRAGDECFCMANAGVTSVRKYCALARGLGK